MKYINQLDYPHWLYVTRTDMETAEAREKGKTTTISKSGCGLCSAIMVADRLLPNCNVGLKEMIDLSYVNHANHKIGTDFQIFAPAFAQKMGFKLEMTNDLERLRFCLRTGGAAVIHTSGDCEDYIGVFSKGGHYIAAIGEEPDGRIAILDPSYKEGKYEIEGRLGKVEVKKQVVALCDGQVLINEIAKRDPGFYLFWRS